MSEVHVYNTLTNQKELLVPLVPAEIGMYVCGVTVYDYCHMGHARGAMVFDIIRRYLEYKGFKVKYVRNFTDIDDKIINRAKEEGCSANEVAAKYTSEYCVDMGSLGIGPATIEPKATDHMKEIITLIGELEKKGYAYKIDGDVFYEIAKFSGYGRLSNRNIEEMRAGARIEVDARKKDPLDFALWKSAKEGEPAWQSPWGYGRPGWHIECSAMAMKHLGETFDIHGGGKDLIFPHHENEIAQSEACTGKTFARYWLHNGFVNINQEKMSKSLKNFLTIKEVLAKGSTESIRLFLLSTHYRSPINFTLTGIEETSIALDRVYNTFRNVEHILASYPLGQRSEELPSEFQLRLKALKQDFEEAMNDDFNTAGAIGRLYEAVKEVNIFIQEHSILSDFQCNFLKSMVDEIKRLGGVLGLFQRLESKPVYNDELINDLMDLLLEIRKICRAKKEWSLADLIRTRLQDKGIIIEDRKEGALWKRKK